ncbi:Zn-ribbon domain-containing OB-fold protein [Haladaptatus sp. CMSO5]|uniref:Zn-ribbon domain-containing OB-fold protein n=1 Tax=Haladaptatus sp. CMSO5 TaxID=3120514 RepID=UPI002FCE4501
MGAYVSIPTWWQQLDSRYRLVVGQCPDCEAFNFPPEGACATCASVAAFERIEPEGTGTIVAHTVIEGGAPPEFEALLEAEDAIGAVLVELDEGVRVPGMLTDCDPHEFARGDRVEAVVRKMFEQEGIVRYGAKFRPI